MDAWLGEALGSISEAEGVGKLVEKWLRVFGPGTAADIKWWLGSTVAAARRALTDLHAVEVDLGGQTGYVLPDDLESTDPVEPWVALLPPLDPTTMGWFERDWYLGPYKAQLFDTTGNAGPTVWRDGRIVGGWCQNESGDGNLGSTRVPPNHSVNRAASRSMARSPSEPTSSSICSTTSPASL